MGLFDKFKKENKIISIVNTSEEKEVEAIGWQAIEKEFTRVYPGQDNPKHYATIIKWIFNIN